MFVTGEIQYLAVFLEASRLLNPSVPYLGLLFLNSPPHLFSVNRFSMRLPDRISIELEDSSPLPAFVLRPGGREKRKDNHYGEILIRD